MTEDILGKYNITQYTKHHTYEYLYDSFREILQMQVIINTDQALKIIKLEERLTKLQ